MQEKVISITGQIRLINPKGEKKFMKKRKAIIAVTNQEEEDFEGYTLHPENAIEDPELNNRIKKHNPDSKITGSVKDNSDKFKNVSPLTIVRDDD